MKMDLMIRHSLPRPMPVLRHRVILTADAEIDGLGADQVLGRLLQEVDAPRA